MAHPWVPDGGDGLKIRTVAVNIPNKQSWTADIVWSSSFSLMGGPTAHHKIPACYEMLYRSWDLDAFFGMT